MNTYRIEIEVNGTVLAIGCGATDEADASSLAAFLFPGCQILSITESA